MTEELPDKLPLIPCLIGSCELDMNSAAIKYNSLLANDPQRKDVYQQYKKTFEEVRIGLMD